MEFVKTSCSTHDRTSQRYVVFCVDSEFQHPDFGPKSCAQRVPDQPFARRSCHPLGILVGGVAQQRNVGPYTFFFVSIRSQIESRIKPEKSQKQSTNTMLNEYQMSQ